MFSLKPHLALTKPHKKNLVLQKEGQELVACTILPELSSAKWGWGTFCTEQHAIIYIVLLYRTTRYYINHALIHASASLSDILSTSGLSSLSWVAQRGFPTWQTFKKCCCSLCWSSAESLICHMGSKALRQQRKWLTTSSYWQSLAKEPARDTNPVVAGIQVLSHCFPPAPLQLVQAPAPSSEARQAN